MKIEIPNNCPSCSYELVRVKDILYCKSTDCVASLQKKLQHYAKTLKIKGLGEKTIEKLRIFTVPELYSLTNNFIINTLGEKLGTKLNDEINNSKMTEFSTFVAALSIPLIGNTIGAKLAVVVNSLADITELTCIKAGLGKKATANITSWIDHNKEYQQLPIAFVKTVETTNSETIKVCISGSLKDFKTKAKAAEYLKKYSIKIVSSLTKDVEYLISEDGKDSSKTKKAGKYNIPVKTINELISIISSN